MGVVYHGPYADEVGYDKHEGYAATVLPDGGDTATTTASTVTAGYRAACSCEWRGTKEYPATEAGEEAAVGEWNEHHLRPMVRAVAGKRTVPVVRLLDLAEDLRATARRANVHGDIGLPERSHGVLDAVESLEDLLDDLADQEKERN